DDIELGCGGSLLQLSAQGYAIRAVVFSRGQRGALSDEDRARESALAFSKIGIDDVHIYDFPDTKLWQNLNELIAVIEGHVKDVRPCRVYTMFQHDRHQDHRVVYEATAVACRNVPQLLGYETPSSYPHFRPTVFQAIEAELDSKIAALQCHASQGARLYMQEHSVRAAAAFRGAQIGMGPAEGFMAYKLVI
ncbi:MAG TPA: PIG-L deacetylase family protein, partial [Novosphingobium sp.]